MPLVGLTTLAEILNRHVRLFNDGVRTGNFGPMTSHFVESAEMSFEGIHVGLFRGRGAIERAYSMQPPDDEIVVLNVKEETGRNAIICEYAWSKKPRVRAGELILTSRGEMVEKLTVRYEQQRTSRRILVKPLNRANFGVSSTSVSSVASRSSDRDS